MTWLSRFFGKTKRPDEAPPPVAPEPAGTAAPLASPPIAPPASPDSDHADDHFSSPPVAPDAIGEADGQPSPSPEPDHGSVDLDAPDDEEEPDEADPTIGRYEPLDDALVGANALAVLRADAERSALSSPHRVGPSDPAGPGSLVEALMRLEGEGRVRSQVCDDPETGFYVLYEPAADKGA